MKCPRHDSSLNSQVVTEHEINQCPECEGLWLQGSAIDQLLGGGELLKLRSLCSIKKSDLLCPTDSHQLFEGKIGPVTVDLCQQCNGLWLDPGELESLLKRQSLSPHVSTDSSVEIFHPVSASAELALYGLLAMH